MVNSSSFLNGIRGKKYKAVKSMYYVVKARVRVGGDLNEAFMCSRGLKQGDSCSSILFPLLITELANETALNGKHGITLSPDILQILIRLFADDVVLLSNTIAGLQQQFNAKRLHLVVNFEKSQVVIFRTGGYIAAREKWFNDGMKLKIVFLDFYGGWKSNAPNYSLNCLIAKSDQC